VGINTENIPVVSIGGAIEKIVKEYSDTIYYATEEGLDEAEKILINELSAASPESKKPRPGKRFARSWKGKGRKYKLQRYVGNTKVVEGKSGKIPLSNILEYSTIRGKPFINRTYQNSINKMTAAIIAAIKKEA
jgi:hypothetical protein